MKKNKKKHHQLDMSMEEKKRTEKATKLELTQKEEMGNLEALLLENPQIKKLGILGGTFNPIHTGHLRLAKQVINEAELDLVAIIPTGVSPHKKTPNIVSFQDRMNMCNAAILDDEKFFVSDIESRREGKSFTVDTLNEIKKIAPWITIYFITGADMFLTMGDWKKAKELFSLCVPCASPRDEFTCNEMTEYAEKVGMKDYVLLSVEPLHISSTQVRENVKNSLPISNMVPKEVEKYIKDNKLYSGACKMTKEEMLEEVKSRVSPPRFKHTLGVVKAASMLAKRYGEDDEKAQTAAVLHDIMKDTPAEGQLEAIKNSDLVLSDVEKIEPKLWHALAGYAFAKVVLKVDDEDILNAVKYHTTARANMSLLEKIIYVADFISEERTFDGVDYFRQLAKEDLDKAVYEGVKFCIDDLTQSDKFVHPDSINAFNSYLLNKKIR